MRALLLLVLAACTPKPADVIAAIAAGDHAELARVLDRGGSPNATGEIRLAAGTYPVTAIGAALAKQDAIALALLLAHHADANQREPSLMGSEGRLPLATAAWNGDAAAVVALLAAGARVDGDGTGMSPASYAANSGHLDALAVLLAAGARRDGNGENGTSYPPLAMAAEHTCLPCVRYLLQAGAPVDSRDILGITALGYAVIKQDLEMVRTLLDAHADPMAANRAGWTPAATAEANQQRAIVELFRARGVTNFELQVPPALPPSGMGTVRVPVIDVDAR